MTSEHVERVIRAAEGFIDTEEGRSHTDAVIEAMDPIRDSIAILRACDPNIERNRISKNVVEYRVSSAWASVDV